MQGTATLTIAVDHPAFPGHFPGQPIVPGVVLLDETLHLLETELQRPLDHYQLGSAKFLSPVGPGETLLIRYESKDNGSVRFDISCGERKVATGSLTLPEHDASA
jgi:3-hydroxymyristoyl/3-hydroxydecanoyl-(acyl carrier protein) dehydratase